MSLLCFFLRATGAALSAHHARSRPTTAEACTLVVHAASSTPLPRAPAGLLQRCRPGAACCWAPALRSRALLLLMGIVSVGAVGLELDLWWAEYELWPAQAQRRPDSCKRSRLAAHQVCNCLSLQAASLPCLTCAPAQVLAPLAEVLSGARSLPSWYIRAGGGKATQRADRAAAGLSRPEPTHAALTLRAWALRVVGQAPRGPRWTTVSLLCFLLRATGAAFSAHHARSRATTAEACPLVVHAASSTPLPRAPAGLLQRCRPGAACCWALALRSRAAPADGHSQCGPCRART